MTCRCQHGVADGAPCDEPTCHNHRAHIPPPEPQSERLADWTVRMATQERQRDAFPPVTLSPADKARMAELDALGSRDTATGDLTRGRGFIGVREDGTRAPGGDPWHWSPRNRVAIPVKGAVYAGSSEAAHLVRGIGENAAAEAYLKAEARSAAPASPSEIAASLRMTPGKLRRKRMAGRGR